LTPLPNRQRAQIPQIVDMRAHDETPPKFWSQRAHSLRFQEYAVAQRRLIHHAVAREVDHAPGNHLTASFITSEYVKCRARFRKCP
jgi:hypothetical protein